MIRTATMTLSGVECNAGTLDDGTAYDFTKVYLYMPMDPTRGNALGGRSVEFRYGTSRNFEQFKGKALPCAVEVDLLDVAAKTGTRTIVQAIRFPGGKG